MLGDTHGLLGPQIDGGKWVVEEESRLPCVDGDDDGNGAGGVVVVVVMMMVIMMIMMMVMMIMVVVVVSGCWWWWRAGGGDDLLILSQTHVLGAYRYTAYTCGSYLRMEECSRVWQSSRNGVKADTCGGIFRAEKRFRYSSDSIYKTKLHTQKCQPCQNPDSVADEQVLQPEQSSFHHHHRQHSSAAAQEHANTHTLAPAALL
jgi:hypothetical protein